MQNNIIDDVNKIDETYLHIADKNVPYDQNRPDFGHDHNFVTADIVYRYYIYIYIYPIRQEQLPITLIFSRYLW